MTEESMRVYATGFPFGCGMQVFHMKSFNAVRLVSPTTHRAIDIEGTQSIDMQTRSDLVGSDEPGSTTADGCFDATSWSSP